MRAPWLRLADCFDSLGAREGDTERDRLIKRLGGPVLLGLGVSAVTFYCIVVAAEGVVLNSFHVGYGVCILTSLVGVPLFLFSSVPAVAVAAAAVLMDCAGALGWDLHLAAALRTRAFSLIVLGLDACLVFSLPPVVHNVIIWGALLYLAAERGEASARIGMYVAGDSRAGMLPACDCGSPPCAVPWADSLNEWSRFVIVLLADFVLTRGFATALRQQAAVVAASVSVAAQVSEALAKFDLEAAGGALRGQAGGVLPPGLAGSLTQLLANLASYRPYLPQSCFEGQAEGGLSEPDGSAGSLSGDGDARSLQATRKCDDTVVSSLNSTDWQRRQDSFLRQDNESSASSGRSSVASGGGLPIARLRSLRAPVRRSVTLLARNTSGLLAAPALATPVAVSQWLADEVERFLATVTAQGGTSDLLSGDHFTASFGALRVLGTQRESAVLAAVSLSAGARAGGGALCALPVTSVVCSGKALCGDFGSAAAQRFMVIGGVGALLPALERAAAAWGVHTLIHAAVQADIEHAWNSRLRTVVCFPKCSPRPAGLWEVVEPKLRSAQPDEWMYEMENAGTNPWELYNATVSKWFGGGTVDEVLEITAAALKASPGGAVGEGLRALHELAQGWAGGPPPPQSLAVVTPPAPLAPLQQGTPLSSVHGHQRLSS